jgi:hypothetical protein
MRLPFVVSKPIIFQLYSARNHIVGSKFVMLAVAHVLCAQAVSIILDIVSSKAKLLQWFRH